MAFFLFFKMAAVRHLGFQKLEILTADTVPGVNMSPIFVFLIPHKASSATIFGHKRNDR